MDARDEELVKALAPGNFELRRSYEKHSRLNDEVAALSSRARLTPEEEKQRRELQKQKLVEKDRIVRILEEHRRVHGEAVTGS